MRKIPTCLPRWLALASVAAFALGCVYDPNQRCDENEELYLDGSRCVCVAGAAMTAHGCVLCGVHEEPGAGACACVAGYVRPSPAAACQPKTDALGTACDSQSAPCADATYSHCQITTGTSGYCTKTGCTGAADCANGYACDTAASVPYCRRPPVGAGQACAAAADCAGTEARFCDTMITHQCHVEGCTLAPDNCFAGTSCCDLSGFGLPQPICVQSGTCPT
ncbi:MAG TPA: hypothetical protein VFH68_25365 [Polyangia bacterium]|jgi:hypothetical protein|nr:hypothetical protein [Polyangia bacterium]